MALKMRGEKEMRAIDGKGELFAFLEGGSLEACYGTGRA